MLSEMSMLIMQLISRVRRGTKNTSKFQYIGQIKPHFCKNDLNFTIMYECIGMYKLFLSIYFCISYSKVHLLHTFHFHYKLY